MNPDDLISLLDAIGQRLDGPSAHVWELVVRQVVAESLVKGVIELLLLVVIVTACVMWTRWVLRQDSRGGDDDEAKFMLLAIPAAIAMFVGAFAVSDLTSNMIHLLNPEYAAIERIVNVLQGAL